MVKSGLCIISIRLLNFKYNCLLSRILGNCVNLEVVKVLNRQRIRIKVEVVHLQNKGLQMSEYLLYV